jgi:hypothetical protein
MGSRSLVRRISRAHELASSRNRCPDCPRKHVLVFDKDHESGALTPRPTNTEPCGCLECGTAPEVHSVEIRRVPWSEWKRQ